MTGEKSESWSARVTLSVQFDWANARYKKKVQTYFERIHVDSEITLSS